MGTGLFLGLGIGLIAVVCGLYFGLTYYLKKKNNKK